METSFVPIFCFFFRYAAPPARSERTKFSVVMLEFAPICIYLVISLLVSLILLGLPFLFSSNSSTYPEKLSAYECGFDPFGDARSRFDIRFYLVSILFIIPDSKITFSFSWAVPPSKIKMPSPNSNFIVVIIIYLLFFSTPILATKYEASTRFKPKINGRKEGNFHGDKGVEDCLPKGIRRSSAPSRYINDQTLGTTCSSIKKVNKP